MAQSSSSWRRWERSPPTLTCRRAGGTTLRVRDLTRALADAPLMDSSVGRVRSPHAASGHCCVLILCPQEAACSCIRNFAADPAAQAQVATEHAIRVRKHVALLFPLDAPLLHSLKVKSEPSFELTQLIISPRSDDTGSAAGDDGHGASAGTRAGRHWHRRGESCRPWQQQHALGTGGGIRRRVWTYSRGHSKRSRGGCCRDAESWSLRRGPSPAASGVFVVALDTGRGHRVAGESHQGSSPKGSGFSPVFAPILTHDLRGFSSGSLLAALALSFPLFDPCRYASLQLPRLKMQSGCYKTTHPQRGLPQPPLRPARP